MKTFGPFKSSKQSALPREEMSPTSPTSSTSSMATAIGKPPEYKSGTSVANSNANRRSTVPAPPPPPPRPQSVAFTIGPSPPVNTTPTTPSKSSPLSIFRKKPKASPIEIVCNINNNINNLNNVNVTDSSKDKTLMPTPKDFKASSSSPPSAEYLQQHRPSCPSVSTTGIKVPGSILSNDNEKVIMRDNSTKERSNPLTRASYHPNSSTNLLANPNPNSSRERGFGAVPARTSSSFTSSRDKDSIYPKYCPKRRFRGPYSQLLESKMNKNYSNTDFSDSESSTSEPPGLISKLTNGSNWTNWFTGSDSMPKMSFTEELLRETMKRRKELDNQASGKQTPERVDSQSELKSKPNVNVEEKKDVDISKDDKKKVKGEDKKIEEKKPQKKSSIKIKSKNVSSDLLNKNPLNDAHHQQNQLDQPSQQSQQKHEDDNKSANINKHQSQHEHQSNQDDNQHISHHNQPHQQNNQQSHKSTEQRDQLSQNNSMDLEENSCENSNQANVQLDVVISADYRSDGASIMAVIGQHLDTRTHIVGEMYDLEKSYCEFLRSLLDDLSAVEHTKSDSDQSRMIDTILSRLPPVLEVHSKFLEQLRRRISQWTAVDSQIGDLFELFRSPVVDDFYEVMVGRLPEFLPYLKQVWKGRSGTNSKSRCKTLPDDMLIRIIQRMPQYKILLDRLLKNTPSEHSDFSSLKCALDLILQVLDRMNAEQSTPQSLEGTPSNSVSEITTPMPVHSLAVPGKITHMKVREIENIIEGLIVLNIRPDESVHFFDYVMIGKRKRVVFLLDNYVLICEIKRRYKSSTVSSSGNTLRDSRFKLEQNFEIEKIDLRCQCWQSHMHHYSPSNTTNNVSNIPILTPTDLHLNGNCANLRITGQLQATVSTESLATSIGCASCIETLEADVKTLTKLRSSASDMCSVPIRKLLKDNLNEIQDTVYRQLMSMHTTILECSLDCNVDLYAVPACVNHTITDQNLVELYRLLDHQPHSHLMKGNHNNNNNSSTGEESISGKVDITAIEAFENQTKFRLTHLRCPQHQPTTIQTLPSSPLISLSFNCNKKRAYFETVLLSLRANLFKSKLSLNSVCSMPYEKTRLTLQFRCAGAALGTNNIWICTSDRGQAQISLLVLSSNSEIEHSIVSCNTVATSQILSISSVPGTEPSVSLSHINDISPTNDLPSRSASKVGTQELEGNRVPNRDEKMRSNSIQVPAFFHNLKSNKNQQQRHSRHFTDRETILLPTVSSPNPPSSNQSSPGNDNNSNINNNNTKNNCSSKHPTMWFATADQYLSIYSCFDNIRTGKHKTKIAMDATVEAIQYYSERVFVALSNSTVAIFQRDATGHWQSDPTLIENTLCNKLCVVHNSTTNKEQLWAASLNAVTIRDVKFNIVEETIHMHESEKIASMVTDGRTIVLTLVDSCDIYRYSTTSPYQHICTISIGPFVDKALSTSDQIIRFHKLACLKISDLHSVQNRIWIGTSAGVLLVLDVSNSIHIVPDGFTGRVSFIVSTRLDNGQTAVLSGGDGRERYRASPGNAISTMAGPAELYNFMSFCSNAPNSQLSDNVESSNDSANSTGIQSPASISLSNSPLQSSHTAQIVIRRAIPSRSSQLSPSNSTVSRTSDGSMTSGVSSAGTILSCDSIEAKELNSDAIIMNPVNCQSGLRSGTATGTLGSLSNTPNSSQAAENEFHSTWGSEDSQSYLLVWKL